MQCLQWVVPHPPPPLPRELLLSTVWPHLTEEVVIDNSHHSDLTPLSAPIWTIWAKMAASTKGLAGKGFLVFKCARGFDV